MYSVSYDFIPENAVAIRLACGSRDDAFLYGCAFGTRWPGSGVFSLSGGACGRENRIAMLPACLFPEKSGFRIGQDEYIVRELVGWSPTALKTDYEGVV